MHLCIGVLNIYSVLKFALYILLECIQSDPQPQNNICQRKKLDCNFCCQHHYIGQTLKIQVKEFLDNIKRKCIVGISGLSYKPGNIQDALQHTLQSASFHTASQDRKSTRLNSSHSQI